MSYIGEFLKAYITDLLVLNYDRLTKENGLYRKEVDQLEAKKNKFIADGAEHWDISNAVRDIG